MDIYSLASSTHSVIEYLERIDPQAAEAARMRYSCFDRCIRGSQYPLTNSPVGSMLGLRLECGTASSER